MGNAACWRSPQQSHRLQDSNTLTAAAPTDPVLEKETVRRATLTDTPQLTDRSSAPEEHASQGTPGPTIRVVDALLQSDDVAADIDSTKTTAAGLDGATQQKGSTQQRRPLSESAPKPLMLFPQFGCEQHSTAAHLADRSPTLRTRDAERSPSVLSRSSPSVTFAEVVFIARGDAKATGPLVDECSLSVSLSASQRPCCLTSDLQRPDAFDDDSANPLPNVARRFSSHMVTSMSSAMASDVQPVSPGIALEDSGAWMDTVSLEDHCAESMRYALPIGARRNRQHTPSLRRTATESRMCVSIPVVLIGSTSGRQSRATIVVANEVAANE